jgi:hypothetical protein
MRRRTVGGGLTVLLAIGLTWPIDAAAQHPRSGHASARPSQPGPGARPSQPGPGARPAQPGHAVPRPVYSHGGYYPRYSYYPRYGYYSPYYWNFGLYWGWGYPAYGYPYYYGGYGYPYWGYGGWGYPYYYYDNDASVRIQGPPREAQVFVDGYFVGIVDDFDGTFQRLRVSPGGHEITLHAKGYRNATERMYLQPHSTYRLRAQLEPLAAGAPEEPPPTPNPDAVRVRRDDRPDMERPPAEPDREPSGPPSDRWPAREQAEQQQAAQGSRFGTLTLRVQPPDAEVIIDGTLWRGAADESGVLAIQTAAGTHRIEIRREGFVNYVADVNVRASATTPLNVMLQREN